MITKRKPTRYNILVSGETTKPQTLELLGSIVAFTPEQARHRGANQFADTLTTGTQPTDRVAVVVTAPLTTNEHWVAFAPGELKVFVGGALYP